MSTVHKVFVYGTLKQNEPNHHWITEKENGVAKFLGSATTKERFPLVIASRYNIPYVLAKEGTGEKVKGEVYEVDDLMLSKLDILEDHPKYYERKIKDIVFDKTGKFTEVWIYLLHKFKPHMLELPFLESYESEGDHGLKYIARYLRKLESNYWTDVKEDE